METIAILRFETYEDAMNARDAVSHRHSADLSAARVDLRDDEAGPTQGNFVTGNKLHDGKQTGQYAEQFKNPCVQGPVVVIAECHNAEAAARVTEFLAALGGREVQAPSAPQ
ncbi:hypothetical protein [Bordetella genomosp. 9]|uniref:Uncharacterized protein n=1 Tax=Bordetella genomosp. 9 TaxID=1416803 RepID=A0A1W6YXS2_9BORD|nr:hypothetical protein [Bordetella genomosp. 9]ARP85764.1 hypothetical protein CAL13_05740 [Bordetella genomosp. 9]ARP89742.1 hypothetical protein CAL14_05115 [Bordetella genomosp. 9]